MIAKTYTTIDKSAWSRGPWDNEADKEQFVDEATGLPCLIVRNRGGALCGYVGVPGGHPAFGKNYDDVTQDGGGYIDVHGGLTFSDFCQPNQDESKGICHVPGDGEPDQVWWLGFDCAHCDDVSPGYDFRLPSFGEATYKTVDYVKAEIRKLAEQLATLGAMTGAYEVAP